MIDKLIFYRHDYYPLLNQQVGRIPKTIEIPVGVQCIVEGTSGQDTLGYTNKLDTKSRVLGIKIVNGTKYYMVRMSRQDNFGEIWQDLSDEVLCWVESAEVIPIWGGKLTLLNHLYQAIKHAFTFRNGVGAWL